MRLRNRTVLGAALAAVMLLTLPALAETGREGWVGEYPPIEVVFQEIRDIANAHPDLVELQTIGSSVQGRPIYAVHVGRKDGKTRPEALLTANIHAEEVLGSRVSIGAIRRLVEDDGKDPWITSLLDRTDFWVIPVLNPDGYNECISHGGKSARKNAHGVDLNRNYPLAPGARSHHPMAGNRRPRSSYYMGPEQLSEPETRAIAEFVKKHRFYACINSHTVAGKFLYPHCYTKVPTVHQAEFQKMGEAFVARQPDVKYKVQVSYSWYPTLGDMDDFLYMQYGIMSVTVEHGTVANNLKYALTHPKVFWVANPRDPGPWVENDRDALLAAVEAALRITGGKPFDPATCRPVKQ